MLNKLKFFFTNIKDFIPYILFIFILSFITISCQSGWKIPITLTSVTSSPKIHSGVKPTLWIYFIYLFIIPYAISYLTLLCKKVINKDNINQIEILKESRKFYSRELLLILLIYIILILLMTFIVVSCIALLIYSKTMSVTATIIFSIVFLIVVLFVIIFTIWLTPATIYLPYKNVKILEGLKNGINLGKKNFWRLLGASLLFSIPILIAALINIYILYMLVCSIVGTFFMFYICTLIPELENTIIIENKEEQ